MTPDQTAAMASVICEVIEERHRQHAKWGVQDLPDGTGGFGFRDQAERAKDTCRQAFMFDLNQVRCRLAYWRLESVAASVA